MKVYAGVLDFFYETGMDNVIWVLNTGDNSNRSIEIEAGDHLVILGGPMINPVFNGIIVPSYPHSSQPKFWVQKDWPTNIWAKLFCSEKKFQAVLIKNPNKTKEGN